MAGTRQPDSVVRDRRQRTLAMIRERGEVRLEQLAAEFGVSLMTTRRDLERLVEQGLVRQSRGWVTPAPPLLAETSADYRLNTRAAVKEQLAGCASRELRPGLTIMLDDSTTCLPLVRSLGSRTPLTLITNFLRGAREASTVEGVDVVLVGGHYRSDLDSCLGSDVGEQIRSMRADIAFVSVPAVADGVVYHPISESAAVKRAMLGASSRHVLIADATKYGRTAPFAFAKAADFDVLVTEASAPDGEIRAFETAGAEVREIVTADNDC